MVPVTASTLTPETAARFVMLEVVVLPLYDRVVRRVMFGLCNRDWSVDVEVHDVDIFGKLLYDESVTGTNWLPRAVAEKGHKVAERKC